jgi:hypothetical protein
MPVNREWIESIWASYRVHHCIGGWADLPSTKLTEYDLISLPQRPILVDDLPRSFVAAGFAY